jgi:hypothetical protein
MATIPLTIGEFFEENLDKDVLAKTLEPEKQTKLSVALKGTPELSWDSVAEEIEGAYRNLFDIDMLKIFCGGWAKLKKLQEYLDKEKHPPEEASLLTLAEHTISSKHHPHIDIMLGEKRLFELAFEVLLKFKLMSFVLKIQDGCIHEIKAGSFIGAGIVKCGGQKLVEKKSGEHKLPGSVAFKECFKIPKLM